MTKPLTNKVLLIGWDAADWKVITPLVDEGKMPNMKKFLTEGVMGNLATLYPILSPMLWTSIATGKRAYKHGVHGFSEPDPEGRGCRPITNLSRKTKAIWNILNQEGKRCNVVGWWPSYPVEPINGVMVSNHYQEATTPLDKPWPMQPGTVHPERLIEPLKQLRIHPHEIDEEQLLLFVPRAAEIDQEKDKRLHSLAKVIAECASIHAAATGIMQLEPWDFMGVYYDAIDHFGHGFMKYHPPKSPWISQEDFDFYNGVIESAYRFHDLMLGTLMTLAGDDTTIIICSDHGFHPDRLRPQFLPNEPAGPAEEHRPFGMVAMRGPGIKKDEVIFGANLMDITPTILTLFGLPVGMDMDGKPLVTALENNPEVEYIESWDNVPGDSAMHPPNLRVDAVESQSAIEQLVELGYIEAPDANVEEAVQQTVKELQYNLARSYIGANHHSEAIPILEELWEKYPDEGRFGVNIFQSLLALGRIELARENFEKLVQRKKETSQKAVEELQKLGEELKEKKPEDYTQQEHYKLRKLRARAGTNLASFAFLRGCLLQAEGKYSEAIQAFAEAKDTQLHNLPSLYLRIGELYLAQRNWLQADSHFLEVLELDPVNAEAHLGLARSYLKQRHHDSAVKEAMAALGLIYHNPQAHFICGVALYRCGQLLDAIKALETAIAQNPVFPIAHRYLGNIYSKHFNDGEKANQYRKLANLSLARIKAFQRGEIDAETTPFNVTNWYETLTENYQDPTPTTPLEDSVIIVSGLPRSGTSMMMQMLAAGGVPILTDEVRQADESNPLGYYELEKAKQLGSDTSWISEAKGQAVKIVAQLLPRLPLGTPYRIIFMQRPLIEVISSQEKMLQKLNKKGSNLSRAKLAETFNRQLDNVQKILNHYDTIDVLYLNYHDVIADPGKAAARINRFLGGNLNEEKMGVAVKPNLWHQKAPVAN